MAHRSQDGTDKKEEKMIMEENKQEEKKEVKKSKADEIREGNEELKKLIEERESLLQRNEELESKKLVSGLTDAGQALAKPKEETPKEYAERVLSGKIKS